MYNLGDLVWVTKSTSSVAHEGWALVVDKKSTKLMDESCMVDIIVFIAGHCKQISPDRIVSFNFLKRHPGEEYDKH